MVVPSLKFFPSWILWDFLHSQMETTAVPPMGDDDPIQGSIMGGVFFFKFGVQSKYNLSIDLN